MIKEEYNEITITLDDERYVEALDRYRQVRLMIGQSGFGNNCIYLSEKQVRDLAQWLVAWVNTRKGEKVNGDGDGRA